MPDDLKVTVNMSVKKKREPVHKVFYLCSKYTPDAGWQEFLRECSYDNFPRGVRFEDNAIKCTRKQKAFTVYLPKDSEKAFEVIIQVFRDQLGVKTSREKKSADTKFDKALRESQIVSWTDARTAAAKLSLVRNFVERFGAAYYLSEEERRDMICLLELAIATKILKAEHIHINGGVITDIDGLSFDTFSRRIALQGKVPDKPQILVPRPLDYTPVPQMNHAKAYFDLLGYHSSKLATPCN